VYDNIHNVQVIDGGANLSDHCPLVLDLSIPFLEDHGSHPKTSDKPVSLINFRWDHGDVISYYYLTYELLNIIVPGVVLSNCRSLACSHAEVVTSISLYYNNIVSALYDASCSTIPRKASNFYKHWWDEELSLRYSRRKLCNLTVFAQAWVNPVVVRLFRQ